MITIQIDSQGAIARLKTAVESATRPDAVLKVAGREGANRLRAHFRRLDREKPNKMGARREHFWLQVGRSITQPKVDAPRGRITISITDPRFAQKLYGGVIRAKRGRFLTIPVSREAYGRSASVFEREEGVNLVFIRQRNRALLASVRGVDRLQVEYILTPQVRQERDPDALPDLDTLAGQIADRAATTAARQMEQI